MPGFERMRLALRMMRRELRAGELTVLLAALLVAVAAMSSVGFFTNRVDRALHLQASQLLAADVVAETDHCLPYFVEVTAKYTIGVATPESRPLLQ